MDNNSTYTSKLSRKIMRNLQLNNLKPDFSLNSLGRQSRNNESKYPQYRIIKSAKNQSKKQFNFSVRESKMQRKLRYEKVKHKKSILVKQIQNLKQGAVNAIIQKQQEIQKLKEQIEIYDINKKNHNQQQINGLHLDLQMKTFQFDLLKKQFIQLQNKFVLELPQKDKIVLQLGQQIQKFNTQINELNDSNSLIKKRLSDIEIQNETISQEIINSNQSIHQLKQCFNNSAILGSSKGSQMQSIKSHLNQLNERYDQINQDHLIFLNEKEKIEQLKLYLRKLKQKHMIELLETKQFYQDKIEKLKIQYEILQTKKNMRIYNQQQQQYGQIQGQKQINIKNNLKTQVMISYNFQIKTEIDHQKQNISSILMKQTTIYTDNESQFSLKHFHYEPRVSAIKQQNEDYQKQKCYQTIKIKNYDKETQNQQNQDLKKTIKLIFIGVMIGGLTYFAYKIKVYIFDNHVHKYFNFIQ